MLDLRLVAAVDGLDLDKMLELKRLVDRRSAELAAACVKGLGLGDIIAVEARGKRRVGEIAKVNKAGFFVRFKGDDGGQVRERVSLAAVRPASRFEKWQFRPSSINERPAAAVG